MLFLGINFYVCYSDGYHSNIYNEIMSFSLNDIHYKTVYLNNGFYFFDLNKNVLNLNVKKVKYYNLNTIYL